MKLTADDRKKSNFFVKLALRSGILFFLILACMRFYAGYLEQEVAIVSRAIEQLSMQEMTLKQQLSALKSPNRIFGYCRDTLKMQRTTNVGVLKKLKNE